MVTIQTDFLKKEPSASLRLGTDIISQIFRFSVLRVRFLLPIPELNEGKKTFIIAAIQVDAVLLL
jgi:hypothetical protein